MTASPQTDPQHPEQTQDRPQAGEQAFAPAPVNRFYRFVRWMLCRFGALWFRLEAVGKENVPAEGPLLLISNHASNLDPPLAVICLKRECHILAKEELFRVPLLGLIIRNLNAHAVRRGGVDRKALRDCMDVLRSGQILLLFPEGTRTRDGQLQECKPGGAMIALQAGVPVMPVYIDGSFEAMPRGRFLPRPRKIRVFYGKPFHPSEVASGARRDAYETLARVMMERIGQLRETALQ